MALLSSILKFTPLSGAHNEEPLCYLLEASFLIPQPSQLATHGARSRLDPALCGLDHSDCQVWSAVCRRLDVVSQHGRELERPTPHPYNSAYSNAISWASM
jgi:hypothetical protein